MFNTNLDQKLQGNRVWLEGYFNFEKLIPDLLLPCHLCVNAVRSGRVAARLAGRFWCIEAGNQVPQAAWRKRRQGHRSHRGGIPVGRTRLTSHRAVGSPAWSTGDGDPAGAAPCSLQLTRCFGRNHDAGISHLHLHTLLITSDDKQNWLPQITALLPGPCSLNAVFFYVLKAVWSFY